MLVDEMSLETAWMLEAGCPELPEQIPDWVLEDTPLPVLQDLWGTCGCGCGRPGCCSEEVAPTRSGWEGVDPRWPVSECVAALHAAVDAICAQEPAAQEPGQALIDAEAVLEAGRKLRVHELDRIADVQDRELFVDDGWTTARSWLTRRNPDADGTDVRFAQQSRHFTHLRAAVTEGLVSIAAAKKVTGALRRAGSWVDRKDALISGQPSGEVVAGVVRNVPVLISECNLAYDRGDHRFYGLMEICEAIIDSTGSELDKLERAHTLLAELAPLERLSVLLTRLFHAMVPQELERLAAQAEANRRCELTRRPDGHWALNAILTPECGEYAWTALNAMLRRDQTNPLDTAAAEALRHQGLDPYQPDSWPTEVREQLTSEQDLLPRSRKERVHDAVQDLLRTFLDKGLGGTHHKVPVQVNVTITEPSLTGQPGALPATGDSGQSIPPSLLRRWWCDSRITAFVLAKGGQALRAIHAGRTLTALERRGLLIEQGHRCAVTSCRGHTREGPHLGIDLRPHHVRRYTDDGRTWLDETVMICDSCHRDLHEGGKTLRLRNDRLINEHGWVDAAALRPEAPPF